MAANVFEKLNRRRSSCLSRPLSDLCSRNCSRTCSRTYSRNCSRNFSRVVCLDTNHSIDQALINHEAIKLNPITRMNPLTRTSPKLGLVDSPRAEDNPTPQVTPKCLYQLCALLLRELQLVRLFKAYEVLSSSSLLHSKSKSLLDNVIEALCSALDQAARMVSRYS